MTQATTKTVRNIARNLGIPSNITWTDAPYVNKDDRTVVFGVHPNEGPEFAEDLNAALFESGFEDTTASYTNTAGWGYVRVKRAVIA